MGAIMPGRWQSWQDRCRIGSTSLWKVGPAGRVVGSGAGDEAPASRKVAPATRANARTRVSLDAVFIWHPRDVSMGVGRTILNDSFPGRSSPAARQPDVAGAI